MMNFTLANFYDGFYINDLFLGMVAHNQDILRAPIAFNQIAGSMPFNSWAGGMNSCLFGNIALYNDIEQCFKANHKSLRLDFSSIVLDNVDFYNNYNRLMLEHGANGATVIEIANLQLYEYIKSNYPTYNKFVLAPSAWLSMEITPEILDTILSNPDFILASLPQEYATEEYVSQVKAKNKLEVTVNPICRYDCKNAKNCLLGEQQYQYEFSGQSNICACPWTYSYMNNPQTVAISDLDKYKKMGINHFRLSTTIPDKMVEYFIFLVKYFIKEEKQQELIEYGMLAITANMSGGSL